MGLLDLLLVAVGLSMDAFAVSVCKGLNTKKHPVLLYNRDTMVALNKNEAEKIMVEVRQ